MYYDRPPVICVCFQISQKEIESAIREGATSYEKIQEKLFCGKGCGTCEEDVRKILESFLGKENQKNNE